ncbi:dihydropteroate synthase [Actinocrinis puniceicyclus]|uniref:Dihydropteroate synthase n=1 Tax=Actinocrinis puniceicyclus TaxID=977794 RepID=A0A8J7WPH0_9ACTN|nr:dihydropteroate synthase [Actinocrinis puniceicyclus]MBS2966116.1 dihydropteroate synthase [Actinocrinis puniceicyclus]
MAVLATRPNRRVTGLAELDRCAVMGVVNVTPDSFSDGGRYFEPRAAIAHGLELLTAGVDYLDVGGESTRPGALRVPAEEEMRRIVPVIEALAREGAIISVDTMRAQVARRAVAAGARIVNDVSGGQADPEMIPFVAEAQVPYILMHWRGHSVDMNSRAVYGDVVAEVRRELAERVERAVGGGIAPDRIILDPGLGFAKTAAHDWELVGHLDELHSLGHPVLVGPSRKRFLGRLLAGPDGEPRPAPERDVATIALVTLVAARGAWAVRVHAAAEAIDAVRVAAAVGDPRYAKRAGGR